MRAGNRAFERNGQHGDAGGEQHAPVAEHNFGRARQRADQRAQAQHQQDVDDGSTDHTADGDVWMGLGGLKGDGKLRGGGGSRNHHQPDQEMRESQPFGQADAAMQQRLAAQKQKQNPETNDTVRHTRTRAPLNYAPRTGSG